MATSLRFFFWRFSLAATVAGGVGPILPNDAGLRAPFGVVLVLFQLFRDAMVKQTFLGAAIRQSIWMKSMMSS